ncbi:coiled-coil domain-containing protein 83 isoform X1 [Chroicocephalus ridibundus]|uniref:coiled-coil domain-containing protein 83 isoform X1 n=1 Tax=Chroicocephalus ridibundus TaxID=1192867 RepID=UPI002FDD1561
MEEKKKEEKPKEQLTEPESAFPEALLEFQIETKEAAIDQVLLGLKQVEKKNKELHERNDLLKEQKQAHIRHTLRQIEEQEKRRDEKEVVTRDDVEESLKGVWQYVKDKEQLLKDLHSQIEEIEQRFSVKQAERDYLLEYKNVGSKIQANKIMNLEKDIKQVKDDHHRATEYYRNALKETKEENDRLVEMHMKLVKEQASEDALRYLDKNSCRAIEENEWLKEQIKVYQKEVSDLKASIQLLEKENISIVEELIDSRLHNLGIPRNAFLTQAAGLKDEFPKDEMKEVEYREDAAKTDGDESLRGAPVPRQKKEAFPKIQSKTEKEKPQDSDEELWAKSFSPTVDSLYEDEEDFQEYLKLGPLETQPMCVVGRAMPIHEEPAEMPSGTRAEDGISGKSESHITAQMVKALTKAKLG